MLAGSRGGAARAGSILLMDNVLLATRPVKGIRGNPILYAFAQE